MSAGTSKRDFETISKVLDEIKVDKICLDVANGYSVGGSDTDSEVFCPHIFALVPPSLRVFAVSVFVHII